MPANKNRFLNELCKSSNEIIEERKKQFLKTFQKARYGIDVVGLSSDAFPTSTLLGPEQPSAKIVIDDSDKMFSETANVVPS